MSCGSPIVDDGHVWRRWSTVLAAAEPWEPPARRTVVVSPHPDDESLSSGGLVARQRRLGVEVIVIAVTDGGAAYDPAGDRDLEERRRSEQQEALGDLGVDSISIIRLGVPDGDVTAHEAQICRTIHEMIEPDDLVVAPWIHDRHPDHESTGRAALAAVRQRRADVIHTLFWTWHQTEPDEVRDSVLLRRLALSDDDLERKQRALMRHVSQFEPAGDIDPILDHELAEPARWRFEYYVDGSITSGFGNSGFGNSGFGNSGLVPETGRA